MQRKEYQLMCDEHSPIIRDFFLQNSNIIRLTQVEWSEGLIFRKKFGGLKDEKFKILTEKLKKDLINIKKENNKTYYFYKLSYEIKKLLVEEGLFWSVSPPNKVFYGFEDPIFYKNKELIGRVISHERYVTMNLTKKEKDYFEANNFSLCPQFFD